MDVWRFTSDIDEFEWHAGALLAAEPDRNTVALTVMASLRAGIGWSDDPPQLGWCGPAADADAPASGAVLVTPPHNLVLGIVPTGFVDGLVDALRSRGTPVPGAHGQPAVAEAFGTAWTRGTALRARIERQERLYRLDALHPLDRLPAGRPRAATAAATRDIRVVTEWLEDFMVETELHEPIRSEMVSSRAAAGLFWIWDDEDGTPVSLAARNHAAAGTARVGPVYTPPEHRRHGYGAAITAACTQEALDRGAERVVLFTDLANPTSNSIYQQIGYVPLEDRVVVRFEVAERSAGAGTDRKGEGGAAWEG